METSSLLLSALRRSLTHIFFFKFHFWGRMRPKISEIFPGFGIIRLSTWVELRTWVAWELPAASHYEVLMLTYYGPGARISISAGVWTPPIMHRDNVKIYSKCCPFFRVWSVVLVEWLTGLDQWQSRPRNLLFLWILQEATYCCRFGALQITFGKSLPRQSGPGIIAIPAST